VRYEFAGIVVIPGTNCERRVKGGRVYTMYVCMYRRDPPFCRPLMVEVWFDLRRGGQICLPRITQRVQAPRAVCKGAATVETLLPVRQPALAKAAASLSLWQRTAGLDSRGPAQMRTERVHTVRDR
jgi:hypothetical protein